VERRGKYLLMRTTMGTVILHLGMSGHLRIVPSATPPGRHDHLDIVLASGTALRLSDQRRFGLALWTREDPLRHPLLAGLGREPLEDQFNGDYLLKASRNRKLAVKQFIMNSHVVAGVGNIYASEALFRAGIHPLMSVGTISPGRYTRLAEAIRDVLSAAIDLGGTTLGDFLVCGGKPGYFPLSPDVYGRGGEPCPSCGAAIQVTRLGGRSTYFCKVCQV
jgi:formamidopyrimidine-DNA glycosylase